MLKPFSDRVSGLQPSAIREILKFTADPEVISFAAGNPAPEAFPVETIAKLSADIFREEPINALQYSITEGYPKLREWLKADLTKKGLFRDGDQVVITSGAQQAIETTAKILCNEGDVIICEDPAFVGSLNAFRSYGVKLVGVPMDDDGMKPDSLEEALRSNPTTKFIYTIPNFQNPTGRTTTLQRRKEILALAEKYGVYKNSASAKHPYAWEDRSVYSIATNTVYVGDLVNGRRKCKSFKSKKVCKTSENEWIVVRDNHEPLITREDFEAVVQRLAVKQHRKVENPDNVFRGLMVCGECGRKMVFSKSCKSGRYSCAIYKRYGKSECSRHSITLKQIKQIVLMSIQRNAALSSEGKDRFVEQMLSASNSKKSAELSALKKETEKLTARKLALAKIFQSLYEDKALGKLSEEVYSELSGNVERERTEIQERLKRISEQLGKSQQLTENAEKFAELIRRYTDITELSEELVHLLIEKIVVHERDCVTNTMQVEIYYRFIGKVD